MRLVAVELNGFRRFAVNAETNGQLEVDGPLTAIVGPNEAGKTSLLVAMSRLNDEEPINAERDRTRLGGVSDNQTVIEALFLVEADPASRVCSAPPRRQPASSPRSALRISMCSLNSARSSFLRWTRSRSTSHALGALQRPPGSIPRGNADRGRAAQDRDGCSPTSRVEAVASVIRAFVSVQPTSLGTDDDNWHAWLQSVNEIARQAKQRRG